MSPEHCIMLATGAFLIGGSMGAVIMAFFVGASRGDK